MAKRAITVRGLNKTTYLAGVGIQVKQDSLTLKHDSGSSLTSRCKNHYGPWDLVQLRLLAGSISFTVDLSRVGCACNLAFYFVSAPARDVDGIPIAGNTTYAPGNYYCDANQVGGQWCPEVDVMEANTHAFQATPHKCDPPVGDRHYTHCDRAGCAQNTRYMNQAYGPGPSFSINTLQPFKVTTEFWASGSTLTGMKTTLQQGDHQVVLDHSNCDAAYLGALSKAMEAGMSLRITYWGDKAETMSWLDSPPCGKQSCKGEPATISDISVSGPNVASMPHMPRPTTTTPKPTRAPVRPTGDFNCSSGLLNWRQGWSPAKIAWCCAFGSGISCATSARRAGPIRWSNHPDKCLTVARASGAVHAEDSYSLVVWDCEGGAVGISQGFISQGDGRIRWSAHPEQCVDAGPHGISDGTLVRFAKCSANSAGQAFSFPSVSTKFRRIDHTSACIDVKNHSARNGNLIQLWECLPDDDDQVFTWEVDTAAPAPTGPVLRPTTTQAPTTTTTRRTTPVPTTTAQVPMSTGVHLYDCMQGALDAWSYRKRLWCCRHKRQGCPVRIPAVWVYDPVVAYPVHIRVLPKIDGPRTDEMLNPGDAFRISQGLEGTDGILYLKLADGRGWLFDRMPGVGIMCVEYRTESTSRAPFSCAIWYPGCESSWSTAQRRFCCQQTGRGCPQSERRRSDMILHSPLQQSPASHEAFNCDKDYGQWSRSWDPDKIRWCCLHKGLGCTTTSMLMPSAVADCHEPGGWGWRHGGSQYCHRAGAGPGSGHHYGRAFELWRRLPSGPGTALSGSPSWSFAAACCAIFFVAAGLLRVRHHRYALAEESVE